MGINWKLFLSQTVNFFIVFLVLKAFLYKPILEIIKARKKKIEEGLEKAEEASIRLKEVDSIAKEKIREAEKESIEIVKNSEERAKEMDKKIIEEAEIKREELFEKAKTAVLAKEEEAQKIIEKQAVAVIKAAILKTVELDPEKIDEALIKRAIKEAGKI